MTDRPARRIAIVALQQLCASEFTRQAPVDLTRTAAEVIGASLASVAAADDALDWLRTERDAPPDPEWTRWNERLQRLAAPNEEVVIDDLCLEPRLPGPSTFGGSPIRFCARFPLESPLGHPLGALCLLDPQPRHVTGAQLAAVRFIVRQVVLSLGR